MSIKEPIFQPASGSRFDSSMGPNWSLVPLRIPTGWAIRYIARLETWLVEIVSDGQVTSL